MSDQNQNSGAITQEDINAETFTFVDKSGLFEWTFKREALKNFDILKDATWENLHQYKFQEFLHNTKGPAVRHTKVPFEQYYINGKLLSDEEAEKMKHDIQFHEKFDKVIDGD